MASPIRTYMDWNATAPLLAEVAAAMVRAQAFPGNPSSVHSEGRAARALVETARAQVANLVNGAAKNVFFTASGTEATNIVLSPSLGQNKSKPGPARLLICVVEHACGLAGGQFAREKITHLPVDPAGCLLLPALAAALADALDAGEQVLVSLQLANNETGVIQPVRESADLIHQAGGLLHVDAVQGAGKIPVDIVELGADVITLSAHKFGGPKGVGAIVFAKDQIRVGHSLVRGGGQERGQRAGTENVAGIAGFGVAAAHAQSNMAEMNEVRRLRDKLEMGIRARAPDAIIFASDVLRLPNTTCFAIKGMMAETALIGFDMDGVAVSSGSACSSGKVRRSHVLDAMGADPELAAGAIRVSLGPTNTEADVMRFLAAFENRLKALHTQQGQAA